MAWHEAFRRRMEEYLGREAPAFFAALEKEPRRAVRLFPHRGDTAAERAALAPLIGDEIPFVPDAFFLTREGIGNQLLHHGGAVYVQDPAAMAPAAAVKVLPDERILDLCAAPGGKSLALASCLGEDGLLVCNEPSPARRRVLLQNLERCGVAAPVFGLDATRPLPPEWREAFDLVVCDAPCSGEGMFRKDEEAARQWSPELVLSCASRQEAILNCAAEAVSPGGRLLYATCTWSLEENEFRVAAFLAAHPDFSLISPEEAVTAFSRPALPVPGLDAAGCRRFYPHIFPGEGQFLAVLQKEGERPPRPAPLEKDEGKREEIRAVRAFLEENLSKIPAGRLFWRDGFWYLIKSGVSVKDAASPGLLLGEVRKGRFVPHHRLFQASFARFKREWDCSEEEALFFLSGAELPCDKPDGWARVTYLGCPLGGVKVSGGRAKNHYPKGLRRQ